MKKVFYTLLLPILAVFSVTACSSIEYDGEYSKEGYYESQNNVYFRFAEAADTLRSYSFGAMPIDTVEQMVNIPVNLSGMPLHRAQKFRVVIDSASTAKVGVHYEAFDLEREIPADSVQATIPVKFFRKNLSADKDTVSLILRLEATSDLGVRFPNANKAQINVTNVLTEPQVWQYYTYYFGEFERQKYLMLLAYYNSDENALWNSVANDANQLFLNFLKVYRALQADPNYKYKNLLPANPMNPYQ